MKKFVVGIVLLVLSLTSLSLIDNANIRLAVSIACATASGVFLGFAIHQWEIGR